MFITENNDQQGEIHDVTDTIEMSSQVSVFNSALTLKYIAHINLTDINNDEEADIGAVISNSTVFTQGQATYSKKK